MDNQNQIHGITSVSSWFRGASKHVVSTAIIFLYIFNLELEGAGGFALSYLILISAIWFPLEKTRRILQPYLRKAIYILLLLVPLLVWTAANSYAYDSDAIVFSLLAIKTYGWSCCVALLIYHFYDHSHTFEQFLVGVLVSFVLALLLQSFFISISFFANEFAESVNQFLVAKGNLTGLEEYRSKGLANSGGANMSMLLSLGVMASMTIFHLTRQKRYFVIAVLITIASALVGRSGFFVGITFLVLYASLFCSKRKFGLLVGVILGLFVISITTGILETDSAWGVWFFSEAGNSVSDLMSMVAVAPDAATLLFGAGFFEEAIGQYNRTDSGFMKSVYVLGVPLALYFYAVVVYISKPAFKLVKENIQLFKPSYVYFVTMMFVLALCFFEFKEAMLYQNMTGRALFLFANLATLFHLKQIRGNS